MRLVNAVLSLAAISGLTGCGGGAEAPAPTSTAAQPTLSGTVAVGAPITNGTLRVLDANGAVVANNVAIDAQGNYSGVTLTGPGPYRIEACGYAGANYQCLYSVASGPGVANATPLTSATVLLAAGQNPAQLMTGSASGLTPAAIATAQAQLHTSLAPVLQAAGVASNLNFISSPLAAGSHTGHDLVLDALGVRTGQDGQAFVQITPRMGSGNLYLQPGSSTGSVQVATGAASLPLGGIDGLFQQMNNALASASACSHPTTGLASLIATDATMSAESERMEGPAAVAGLICGMFAQGEDGTPMWGSKLAVPTLGRCDLSGGGGAVCRVTLALITPQGQVRPLGSGMGVTQQGGNWKFYGMVHGIEMVASAKVQRDRRIDGPTPVDSYTRALAFEISSEPGLACARVSQRNANGQSELVAYYKPGGGPRLSLWTDGSGGQSPSLQPLQGEVRGPDDTWIPLPEGTEGDTVVRNFYRGGRGVTISLFADAACSQPFTVRGRSEFEVDVDGVPPVWSAMFSQPWVELDAGSKTALRNFSLGGQASGSYQAAWSYAGGPLALDGATFCGSRACGAGTEGRLGERSLAVGATSTSFQLQAGASGVETDATKMVALYGRTGDGVDVQSNFVSCPTVPAGEPCR